MEIFAGMVECIDSNVGKVVEYLRSIDELRQHICLLHVRQRSRRRRLSGLPMVQDGYAAPPEILRQQP